MREKGNKGGRKKENGKIKRKEEKKSEKERKKNEELGISERGEKQIPGNRKQRGKIGKWEIEGV